MTVVDRPATIKDVAKAVGLSIATVSRAISHPHLLSKSTLARVHAAVEELGYRPNVTAQNLKWNNTRLVVVVVPSLSPFFLDFFRGAEQGARETGYSVLVGHTDRELAREADFIDQVNSRRADGLILVTSADQQALLGQARRLPPMILALDVTAGTDLPAVRVDHAAAAAQATEYLLGLGHRRIAHIAGAKASAMTAHRLEGFQRALAERGVAFDPAFCAQGAFTVDSGEQAMERILSRGPPPTAVFAANDEMAVGAVRALRRAGLSVPGDVSVLGFDDQRIAALYEPALTTVRIPTYEIGYRSMIELARSLAGKTVEADVILPCQLVIRDSARALRADKPQPGAAQ